MLIVLIYNAANAAITLQLYKLYVRPHLDYGDIIYHIPAKEDDFSQDIILPNLMEQLESAQYSAALAVTGTWREKLYAELGWESLSARRWSRRLTLFYKTRKLSARFACASTFLAPAESFHRVSDDPP